MNSGRTQGESEAYRDGIVDAKLDEFARHFAQINGSVERTAATLNLLTAEIAAMRKDLHDATAQTEKYIPKIEELTADAVGTKLVAKTLKERRVSTLTGWETWRAKVAWALGITVTSLLLLRNIIGF